MYKIISDEHVRKHIDKKDLLNMLIDGCTARDSLLNKKNNCYPSLKVPLPLNQRRKRYPNSHNYQMTIPDEEKVYKVAPKTRNDTPSCEQQRILKSSLLEYMKYENNSPTIFFDHERQRLRQK